MPVGNPVTDGSGTACFRFTSVPRQAARMTTMANTMTTTTTNSQPLDLLDRNFPSLSFRGVEAREPLLSDRRLFERSISPRFLVGSSSSSMAVSLSLRM